MKLNESDLYREYIIGINALNKLRYYVPTFAYVLGIFKCVNPPKSGDIANGLCNSMSRGNKTPYVIYERASDNSVTSIIKKIDVSNSKSEESFRIILEIFVQILISLEIAQQEYNFTHFDLHMSNVMTKNFVGNPLVYNVSINNDTYTITTQTMPIIIDYGNSSIKINGKTYGSEGKESVGIMNHMIPGFDMYRFLILILHSIERSLYKQNLTRSESKLHNLVKNLFQFYGSDDYYNITKYTRDGRNVRYKRVTEIAVGNYVKHVPTTKLGTYTPKMFLDWILDPSKKYSKILGNIIQTKPRDIFMPIHTSILTKKYHDIFSEFDQGKLEAKNIIKNCSTTISPSYMTNKYNIYVLSKYNKMSNLNDPEITSSIQFIERVIEYPERRQKMIDVDMNILNNHYNIITPTYQSISKTKIITLLSNKIEKLTYYNGIKPLLKFKQHISPYMKYLYTLKEIRLDREYPYQQWISYFTNGYPYKIYNENITMIDRLIRWGDVLNES